MPWDDPVPQIAYEQLTLEHVMLYSRFALPQGLVNMEFDMQMDVIANHLVAFLRGFVLGEDAGPTQTTQRTVCWQEPVRPKWIPKWAWRKVKRTDHSETVKLSITPQYIYPESTVKVPALGRATHIWRTNWDG